MKFSVIIPVYQVEQYLRQCIDSVLRQSFTDYEVILVDDGSTDGSTAICREYAGRDSRVRMIRQANGGLSAARNTGVGAARGDYLIFLDSDDYWLTASGLGQIDRCLSDGRTDAVFWRYRKVAEDDNAFCDEPSESFGAAYCESPGQLIDFIRSGSLVACAWDLAVSRALFARGGLDFEPGAFSEDVEWLTRLLQRIKRCAFTDMTLNAYRVRGGSITKNIREKNLLDLNSHYRRISQYIDATEGETARMLRVYLGEQTANYVLALVLAPAELQKRFKSCEYRPYLRYCVTRRGKMIRRLTRCFGVSGTVSLIKTVKRFV